jgi:hypothetical protein
MTNKILFLIKNKKINIIGFSLIITLLFSSCYSYNRPVLSSTTSLNKHSKTKIFSDSNGDYYPSNWRNELNSDKIKSKLFFSYRNINKLEQLDNFKNKFLEDFKNKVKNKKNIYILIHGFNNDELVANKAYYTLLNNIDINIDSDEIVELYWDGLVGKGVGSGKIWFNSTGYSQMVGVFALRPLLNKITDKNIIIISHSRGASVVLSSISDPSWSDNFYKDTSEMLGSRFTKTTPLNQNGNKIISIMLAPAIGNIDFYKDKREDGYPNNLNNYRNLNSQLKAIYFTTNKSDFILKKGFKFLAMKFNPTNLGYNAIGIKYLETFYDKISFKKFDFSKEEHGHNFLNYIGNKGFLKMLKNSGIPIK